MIMKDFYSRTNLLFVVNENHLIKIYISKLNLCWER